MGQFSKVLLPIDNANTVLHRALECGLGLHGLNQVIGSTIPLLMWQVYQHLYQTTRNQHDIMTAVVNVSKGQTDMSYKSELQALTKLSTRRQVGPGEKVSINIWALST